MNLFSKKIVALLLCAGLVMSTHTARADEPLGRLVVSGLMMYSMMTTAKLYKNKWKTAGTKAKIGYGIPAAAAIGLSGLLAYCSISRQSMINDDYFLAGIVAASVYACDKA